MTAAAAAAAAAAAGGGAAVTSTGMLPAASTGAPDVAGLLALGSGPALLGVTTLLAYARTVLRAPDRTPARAWSMLGAGALVLGWLLIVLAVSAGAVRDVVTGALPADPPSLLLVASWLAAAGVVVTVLGHVPAAARFLGDSYRPGSGPWLARRVRTSVRRR